MKHESREQFEIAHFTTKQTKLKTSTLFSRMCNSFKKLIEPAFDPTQLSRAQQRDIGIDRYEVERYEALHQPIIKSDYSIF